MRKMIIAAAMTGCAVWTSEPCDSVQHAATIARCSYDLRMAGCEEEHRPVCDDILDRCDKEIEAACPR